MKIALLGYNIENASVYTYLRGVYSGAEFAIYDQRAEPARDIPEGVAFIGGRQSFHDIDADIVVRSPGISPHNITTSGKITTATQLFFENSPTKNIIGVTGSKGKGTTCSFITSILRAGGFTVHLVGNIGQPALGKIDAITPDDVVVYELSSFQLWDLTTSPQTAVVLMIEPDHLDVHTDMAEYIEAKSHIATHQTGDDIVVYQSQNRLSSSIVERSIARKIPVSSRDGVHVSDGYFWYGEQKLCSVSSVILPGSHNLDNACAAIAACWSRVQDPSVIATGLAAFGGLEHRLKYAGSIDEVDYYDDSIATTPGSAMAAISAFEGRSKVIILGGRDKGADYEELVRFCSISNCKIVAIGENGDKISDLAKKHSVECVREIGLMPDVARQAARLSEPSGVVILSPAASSFDQYKNYAERGNEFIKAVEQLAHE